VSSVPGGRDGERLGRTVGWEIIDCMGLRHVVQVDSESIDDQLYLLRRIADAAGTNLNLPGARIRFLGRS
jgi:hypothetical protein